MSSAGADGVDVEFDIGATEVVITDLRTTDRTVWRWRRSPRERAV